MGKETLKELPASMVIPRGSHRSTSTRSLRLEVLDLRRRLKRAEDQASQHSIMLREGDHRIKNSLSIVASLMSGQAARETSDTARQALRGAALRVRSIADIHDALQEGAGGADEVDLAGVLKSVCASMQAMATDTGHIVITVDPQPVQMPAALARPLVLAVNELVTNALRHAFRQQGAGTIHIGAARSEHGLRIVVSDNGAGLPPDYAIRPGYGMTLVMMMVRQIGGALLVENVGGACFTIRVPG